MNHKIDRKKEILEAGLEVFAERGYYNTTTALIAEKAGISQPYIFKFFKIKEELFVEYLQRAYERILHIFKSTEAEPDQLVDKMVEAYEELFVSNPNEIALQVLSMTIKEESIRECTKQGLSRIKASP